MKKAFLDDEYLSTLQSWQDFFFEAPDGRFLVFVFTGWLGRSALLSARSERMMAGDRYHLFLQL